MNMHKKSFNPWPYGIVLTFVIFIASTAALIAFICGHRMDLVSADYYEQEIRFQTRLDDLNRTSPVRAATRVDFEAVTRQIRVVLPAEHAGRKPQGRLELYRPSAAGLDRELKLEPDAGGTQSFGAADLQPGLWKVRLYWSVDGQDYFLDQSLIVPARGSF